MSGRGRTGGDGVGSGEGDRGELRPVAPLGEEDHDERLEDDLRGRGRVRKRVRC